MATSPTIPVFELFPDQPPKELGILLNPKEFFTLATVLSYVEPVFLNVANPEFQSVIECYRSVHVNENEDSKKFDELMKWYCADCAQWGSLMEEEKLWIANPKDFSPSVARFLNFFFQNGLLLDAETGAVLGMTVRIFDAILEMVEEAERQREAARPKGLVRIRRIVLQVLEPFSIFRRQKKFIKDFNLQKCQEARAIMKNISGYCQAALVEKRVFTFEEPKENVATTIAFGDVKMNVMKEGRIIFGDLGDGS